MRLVITLNVVPFAEKLECSSPELAHPAVGDIARCGTQSDYKALLERVAALETRLGSQSRAISVFFGGPYDEQVRRGIPEGEHIVEDPAFDAIGHYTLVQIDRHAMPVAQCYRWVDNAPDADYPSSISTPR